MVYARCSCLEGILTLQPLPASIFCLEYKRDDGFVLKLEFKLPLVIEIAHINLILSASLCNSFNCIWD